ncbi:hypothetical protein LTR84_011416 [Exophiala bonariae]|uniref:Dihydrofolate reductase n=1 Tax=Exophiala bonariae TaxID=1690606 RepID=A0AAV9MRR9_9EURO|nr:hypothetical protein LTR84_011416 [Exophiala bonariae]
MSNEIATPPATSLSDPPSPTDLPEYSTNRRPSNNPFNYPPVYHDDSEDENRNGTNPMASTTSIIKTTLTTIVPITFHPKPIYVIVATALKPSMGIGNQGTLPWSGIKGDMAFFRKLTTKVPESSAPGSLNALIMGRKTWESIPSKFRPLAGRLNVIITRGKVKELGRQVLDELQTSSESESWETQDLLLSTAATPSKSSEASSSEAPDANATVSTTVLLTPSSTTAKSAVLISSSLPRTLSLLSSSDSLPNSTVTPQKVFCIGGANLYSQILALSHVSAGAEDDADLSPTTTREPPAQKSSTSAEHTSDADSTAFDIRILQTQVHKLNGEAFECDTFFPEDITFSSSTSDWRAVSQRTLETWADGVDIPGSSPASAFDFNSSTDAERKDPSEDEADGWVRDDKAGVEYRVVGWERR